MDKPQAPVHSLPLFDDDLKRQMDIVEYCRTKKEPPSDKKPAQALNQ